MKTSRKLILILAATVLLASVDVTYEWRSPIESEGQSIEWYSSLGLTDGRLESSNHDIGADGEFRFGFHAPVFFPMPVYAIGGPEGGGFGMAVWFLVAVTSVVFFVGPRFRRRLFNEPAMD